MRAAVCVLVDGGTTCDTRVPVTAPIEPGAGGATAGVVDDAGATTAVPGQRGGSGALITLSTPDVRRIAGGVRLTGPKLEPRAVNLALGR